ncbi:MAG TPA: hypothetical protein VFG76_06905 [Candidatus Polarisedimenticolia bacterium]|nr:hypothetical protein [Candidatus Polarisedimenticolia bacterium]
MAVVSIDITAVSGTTPVFSPYLQGTNDDGTTWFDIPYDSQLTTVAPATADQTAAKDKRNIANAVTAVGKHIAIYKHLPYKKVRLAWAISGTTPSFTFSAVLSGK